MWPVAVGGGVACHLMLKDLFKLQHLWRTVAFRCQQHKASVRAVSLGLKSPGEGGGDTYRRQPQCPPLWNCDSVFPLGESVGGASKGPGLCPAGEGCSRQVRGCLTCPPCPWFALEEKGKGLAGGEDAETSPGVEGGGTVREVTATLQRHLRGDFISRHRGAAGAFKEGEVW